MDEKKDLVLKQNICDIVLQKVQNYQENNALRLPPDYSVENALKGAWLILQDVQTSDKKPALTECTQDSISYSLLKMVTQGMNPMKKHGYFIAYGKKLVFQESRFGWEYLAKKVGMKWINPNVIYEGDEFEVEVDLNTGRRNLVKHKQDFLNIDMTKIKGAYAVWEMESGERNIEIMNISQIKQAWKMGIGEGKVHQNFTDQMCLKTISNRVCRHIVSSSDDSYLYDENEEQQPTIKTEIAQNANKPFNIDDAQIVEPKQLTEVIDTTTGEVTDIKHEEIPANTPNQVASQIKKAFA